MAGQVHAAIRTVDVSLGSKRSHRSRARGGRSWFIGGSSYHSDQRYRLVTLDAWLALRILRQLTPL
jgi:hypothetical protein